MDQLTPMSYRCKSYGEVPLQVSITSSVIFNGVVPTRNVDTNEKQFQCIRCGISMEKTKSVFVNILPPVFQSKKNCSNLSLEILSKRSDRDTSWESVTGTSSVKSNSSLDVCEPFETGECWQDLECSSQRESRDTSSESVTENSSVNNSLPKSLKVCEALESKIYKHDLECSSQHESNIMNLKLYNSDCSKEDEPATINVSDDEIQQSIMPNDQFLEPPVPLVGYTKETISHPCSDCHVSILNDMTAQKSNDQEYISLMLQVSLSSPERKSVECQTEGSSFNSGIIQEKNIIEIYPKINSQYESSKGESLPGSSKSPQRNLPDLDAEAEAAYRCHLKNLVPCSYCGRTFNPDRVMVHESVCIERPRKKKKKSEKKKSK